jgi:hypothetical protein
MPLVFFREGAVSRAIRESEDLPKHAFYAFVDQGMPTHDQRIKQGHPRIDHHRSGDFFLQTEMKEKEENEC